tara:strand:+ start:1582 stop:2544 length:963 start_codon:yes stop_codon:yes gene_type:complete
MTYTTPVLLIAWRRPLQTSKVIDELRKIKPINLFVACDGPIPNDLEQEKKVNSTREIIRQNINWDCQINTLYSDLNQGCKRGVSNAITWFFNQVDEGIILEDDCVPHQDFFSYCTELLKKYRDDDRVWSISGSNVQEGNWRGDGSYYFGRIPQVWGWATWSKYWKNYDINIEKWPFLKKSNFLRTIFDDPLEEQYWCNIWDKLYEKNTPDTWDYQWCFTCISNGGLTAFPNQNLITNIGFGKDATHTTWLNEEKFSTSKLGRIIHPSFILRDSIADEYTFNNKFGGNNIRRNLKLINRVKRKVKDYFNKVAAKINVFRTF